MTQPARPADIHPETDCRLPPIRREDLPREAQAVYDQLVDPKGDSLVGLKGPGGLRLHSPFVAVPTREISRYLRRDDTMTGRVREVAILVAAQACRSEFEWAAHEKVALKDGVPSAVIEAIRTGAPLDGLPDEDVAIIAFGRELLLDRKVTSATYARALKRLGQRLLVDVVCLMGQYAATAALLTAFDMQLPPGQAPRLGGR